MSRMTRRTRTTPNDRDDRPADPLTARTDAPEADDLVGGADDDLSDELEADPDDTALEEDGPAAAVAEEAPAEEDYTSGPDDALGLYLRQMGAIPLLNRERELS